MAVTAPVLPALAQHPLRNPGFRRLWIGNAISWAGDQFYLVALPWITLQLTGSSVVLGTVTMTAAIPRAALMLLGGAMTDRISPRRIMMLTAAARAILVMGVASLLWAHALQLWQLYILALGFGVADAFAGPAAQAYLPSLVEKGQLEAANSVSQSTIQVATLVAPGPAGLFIKAFGSAWAFFLDAVSFLFILGALWRLPDPPRDAGEGPRHNVGRSILDGLRYVKADAALTSLMLVVAVLNFAIAGPASVGIAFIARQRFGTPLAFGLLMSALAAGGLAGTLLAGLSRQRRRGRLLLMVSAAIGICLGSIGMLAQAPALGAALFAMSGLAAFMNIQLIAWFQQRVERPMMGRVMSVLMFASVGLMPFSLAAAGVAVNWSVPWTFAAAGAMVLAVTLIAASQQRVRQID